jgi:hypothetical protein
VCIKEHSQILCAGVRGEEKKKVDVLWMTLIAIAVPVAVGAWVYYGRNRDVASGVRMLNDGGDVGTALVVYHPGRSPFHGRVFSGFVDGLVARRWRVEITTPSMQAPTDVSGYDLLVLGGPTYGFAPNRPIRRYLRRLGDLGGQPVTTIITAMGAGRRSSMIMDKWVRDANGDLVCSLLLYWMRPNDNDRHVDSAQNRALAVEMAASAAKKIPLPIR